MADKQNRRCTDANIEKLDAMSFDAYKDPKHLSKAKAEDLAGSVKDYLGKPNLEEIRKLNLQTSEDFDPGSIDATLEERGNRYGEFPDHARITQNIKRAMVDSGNWSKLSDDKKEALEMVAHKIGRILNGDPDYHDSWHDIVGYTKLVADKLLEK